jgi:hypothetical protein
VREWVTLRDRHLIDRQPVRREGVSHPFELTISAQSIMLRTTFPASIDPELFSGVG